MPWPKSDSAYRKRRNHNSTLLMNERTMLISTSQLLQQARQNHYAVGAFNVYTLEGVRAVVSAAEEVFALVVGA